MNINLMSSAVKFKTPYFIFSVTFGLFVFDMEWLFWRINLLQSQEPFCHCQSEGHEACAQGHWQGWWLTCALLGLAVRIED